MAAPLSWSFVCTSELTGTVCFTCIIKVNLKLPEVVGLLVALDQFSSLLCRISADNFLLKKLVLLEISLFSKS